MLPYIKDSPTFWEAEGLVNDAIQEISPILKNLNTLYGEYVNVLKIFIQCNKNLSNILNELSKFFGEEEFEKIFNKSDQNATRNIRYNVSNMVKIFQVKVENQLGEFQSIVKEISKIQGIVDNSNSQRQPVLLFY